MEVGCAVVAATSPLTSACIDVIAAGNAAVRDILRPGGGRSAIFDSHGREVSKGLPDDQEGIVYADVEPGARLLSGSVLDTTGHYLRPDVFQVEFFNKPNHSVITGTGRTAARQVRVQMYPREPGAELINGNA